MAKILYRIYYWILFLYFHLFYRFHIYNREKVGEGPVLICANHSSMADPVMIAVGMKNSRGYNQPKFLAKSELSHVPVLNSLINIFIVYVRRGESDIAAVKQSIAHLKDGGKLIVFPEGTRIKEGQSGDVKTGVIMMSMRSGAPLQPVYITECRKPPFCRKRINVVFGDPYRPVKNQGESSSEAYKREAQVLMDRIHALGKTV